MKIIKNMPEVVKGAVLMVAGLALLFHTLGILKDFLWYALLVISLYLIVIGFIKVRGVEIVKSMLKKDKEIIHEEINKE